MFLEDFCVFWKLGDYNIEVFLSTKLISSKES